MSIYDCKIIKLPKISDNRGSLSFVEEHEHIPFAIKRIYYLYDLPSGVERGAHGHKRLQQLMLPIAGSFDIVIDDGVGKQIYHLSRPNEGLYIAPMIWRLLKNFSNDAVCMVLASDLYDEDDYFRQYADFMNYLEGRS